MLRPNPRGSMRYGWAFREAVVEDWGPGPFQDLMAGVDEAIDIGVAHPDSLAIMGGSCGGYMTAYAVTQTDRFGAAGMVACISNLISKVGTNDIPKWPSAHIGAEFWERPETYVKHSRIHHVGNVSTPIQVLHGTEDECAPPSQGREFYRTLDRRGLETEGGLCPRTPHGPGSRNSW